MNAWEIGTELPLRSRQLLTTAATFRSTECSSSVSRLGLNNNKISAKETLKNFVQKLVHSLERQLAVG